MKNKCTITYPFESDFYFKHFIPFLRMQILDTTYYLCKSNQITLINPNQKQIKPILVFPHFEKINDIHLARLNQATKKIKGVNYQPLYVYENQYLCISHHENIDWLVILTIDLNTIGYFEIINVKNIKDEGN